MRENGDMPLILPGARYAAIAALMLLAGCASVRGSQELLTSADLDRHPAICPSEKQLTDTHPTETKGQYRDRIIMACTKAINFKFGQFVQELSTESGLANLGTDLLSQTLSTAASVVDGADLAKKLAAGSALSLGIGSTINKDLFYKQTLPAIVASMEARRDKVLTGIAKSQNADPEAKVYTLARAGNDLDMLQQAGSLSAAVRELTSIAVSNANQAEKERQEAERNINAGVLQDIPADMTTRIGAASDALENLYADGNVVKLREIATNLKLNPTANEDARSLRALIRGQLQTVSGTEDAAKRDELLKAIEKELGLPQGGTQ